MLAREATLGDVAYTLTKPERYVRRALANMHIAERDHGDLVLRIGVTGSGQIPHYRLDTREVRRIFDTESIAYLAVQAFNGRNHEPLVTEGEEADILREEHWSTASMTREEVANLLGAIRKGPRRA